MVLVVGMINVGELSKALQSTHHKVKKQSKAIIKHQNKEIERITLQFQMSKIMMSSKSILCYAHLI